MKRTLILLMTLTMAFCLKLPIASESVDKIDASLHLEISVFQSGRILANGRETAMPQLDAMLTELKKNGGTVWYYREAGQQEPPAQAMEIMKLIAEKGLPVTLSSKPDFSDYVGVDGQLHTREK